MTFDVRVTSSGINESERKRTWQEIDGQDSASKSKKEKHEIDKEGGVYVGAIEVNIEEDEWGNWEYDEDHDGECDPKLLKDARLEEVSFMQNVGVWGAVDLGGVHAKDGQGAHHHQVNRRRQGPRRGGADEEQAGREALQEQERLAELRRIRRDASAGDEEAVV